MKLRKILSWLVMLGLGLAFMFVPGIEDGHILGSVWLVGSILFISMPDDYRGG